MPCETSSTTSTYKRPSPLPSHSSSGLRNTIQLLDRPASTSTPQDTIDADEMAAQTLRYINALNDHASAVHGHPERAAIYQRLLDEKQALPPSSTRWSSLDSHGQNLLRGKMEDIMLCPATTVEEYVSCRNLDFTDNEIPAISRAVSPHIPYSFCSTKS